MKYLQWLSVIVMAVLLFPFLLRTVGLLLAVMILIGVIGSIIAINNQFSIRRNNEDNDRINQRRVSHHLRTEFAKEETFTEEELRKLKERNRLK